MSQDNQFSDEDGAQKATSHGPKEASSEPKAGHIHAYLGVIEVFVIIRSIIIKAIFLYL
jgi:hypothetical protein